MVPPDTPGTLSARAMQKPLIPFKSTYLSSCHFTAFRPHRMSACFSLNHYTGIDRKFKHGFSLTFL